MNDTHAPDPEFSRFLEWQVRTELRRRERFAPAPQGRAKGLRLAGLAKVAALVAASTMLGACGVLATQHVHRSQVAERLLRTYEVESTVAEARFEAARGSHARAQKLVAEGFVTNAELTKAKDAEARERRALQRLSIDIAEIRTTSQAPDESPTAPVFGGRDFVSERLELDLAAAREALAFAEARRDRTRALVSEGLEPAGAELRDQLAVDQAKAAVDRWTRALQVRSNFVDGRHGPSAAVRLTRLAGIDAGIKASVAEADVLRIELQVAEQRERAGMASAGAATALSVQLTEIEARVELLRIEREAYGEGDA